MLVVLLADYRAGRCDSRGGPQVRGDEQFTVCAKKYSQAQSQDVDMD